MEQKIIEEKNIGQPLRLEHEEVQQRKNNPIEKAINLAHDEKYLQYKFKMEKTSCFNTQDIRQKLSRNKVHPISKYLTDIHICIIETDFQTMLLQISYGFYKINASVIFTNIEEFFFADPSDSGSFGFIHFVNSQENAYAIKSIVLGENRRGSDLQNFYQEYFLCYLAHVLQVGPKLIPIFGYDIVLTKNRALFVMEKCQQSAELEPSNIQQNLLQNLKIIHELKLVHLDIKLQNIAYSKCFRRHIFLDFGLSRFLVEAAGQKTFTGFVGTLKYCSEEMKKCYFLMKKRYVDMYSNDLFALQKTLQKLKNLRQDKKQPIILSFDKDQKQNYWHEQKQYTFIEKKILLEYCPPIIRIKYHLYFQQISEFFKLLPILNIQKYPNTICKILTQGSYSKKSQVKQLSVSVISQINRNLLEKNSDSDLDDIFAHIFIPHSNRLGLISNVLPIKQLMQLSNSQFCYLIRNPAYLYHIFLFVNPFSTYFQANRLNRTTIKKDKSLISQDVLKQEAQDQALKKKILFKIADQILQNSQFGITYNIPVMYQSQKVRLALIHFFNTLKELKNVKVILSLRMLFIAIEDWRYVQKAEEYFFQIVNDNVYKVLKMMEFNLFWDIFLQFINHSRKDQWIKKVNDIQKAITAKNSNKNSLDEKQNILLKALKLSKLLMKRERIFYSPQKNKVLETFKQLQEDAQFIENKDYLLTLYYIQFLDIEFCKRNFTQFQKKPVNLTLEIYSFYFSCLYDESLKQLEKMENIFFSISSEYYKKFNFFSETISTKSQNYKNREKLVKVALDHTFYINEDKHEYIHHAFYSCYLFHFKQFHNLFLYMMSEVARKLEYKKNIKKYSFQISRKGFTEHQVYSTFVLILFISTSFERFSSQKLELSKQEKSKTFEMVRKIFNLVTQEQPSNNQGQYFDWYEKLRGTVELKILFHYQFEENQMISRVDELIILYQPLPYKIPSLVLLLINVLDNVRDQKNPPKLLQYSKNVIVHFADSYIESKHFYIFELISYFLVDLIKIQTQRKNYQYCYHRILQYIAWCRNDQTILKKNFYFQSFHLAVQAFVGLIPIFFQQKIYQQAKFGAEQLNCGIFAYFIFSIFTKVCEKVQKADKKRQIIRTLLCIRKIPSFCRIKSYMQYNILKISRQIQIYKNSRKQLICAKKQYKYSLWQRNKQYLKCTKERMNKLVRKSTKQGYRLRFINLQIIITKIQDKFSK